MPNRESGHGLLFALLADVVAAVDGGGHVLVARVAGQLGVEGRDLGLALGLVIAENHVILPVHFENFVENFQVKNFCFVFLRLDTQLSKY